MTIPVAISAPNVRPRRSLVALAVPALTVAIGALHALPFRHVLATTKFVTGKAGRAATTSEAEEITTAIRMVAAWWPGRAACLETSIATAWLAALRGTAVTWNHGARTAPYEFHAWIAADGTPVAEPPTTLAYQPLITIAPTSTRGEPQ
jgi:hypothetical protein